MMIANPTTETGRGNSSGTLILIPASLNKDTNSADKRSRTTLTEDINRQSYKDQMGNMHVTQCISPSLTMYHDSIRSSVWSANCLTLTKAYNLSWSCDAAFASSPKGSTRAHDQSKWVPIPLLIIPQLSPENMSLSLKCARCSARFRCWIHRNEAVQHRLA